MVAITLPDGSVRSFPGATTGAEVARSIGVGLAKAALAVKVNGHLQDLGDPIAGDARLAVITNKDEEGVAIIRHSAAHLLGHALQQLWPETKMVIGPVIENGFYYDIASEHRFSPEDLVVLEKRMRELAKTAYPVEKEWVDIAEARRRFDARHASYKLRLIDDFDPGVRRVGLYRHQEYLDMCRGPHVPHMGHIKAFKLTRLSGSYWRGDASGEPLQRIYGVAFRDKKELDAYLEQMVEAEKRDHRRLGRQLDLFHFQEEAPGMVFWHRKGATLYHLVEGYMRAKNCREGFEEVISPQILDRALWERSGHWDKFGGNMFTTAIDERDYAIKPMNCPGHIQIFRQGLKSYRDLPVRYAEFGVVHRNEPSGTLHGLMRARRFTQDDAHIFCTRKQIKAQIAACNRMIFAIYRDFGFTRIELALSTRPKSRVGVDSLWDEAEAALQEAMDEAGLVYRVLPGEGAFYGPKIEFTLKDSIGRRWQCGTVQLDFSMPGLLGAQYVDEHGEKRTPVMIHRAVLGSLERFIGILIEQYAGAMPLWLSPMQAVVLPITDAQRDYVEAVTETLQNAGIRAEKDLRNEKISYKIREHTVQRTPYLLIAGQREKTAGTVSLRTREGTDLGVMSLEEVIARARARIERKTQET